MDDCVLMERSFIWKLLFMMSHPSEWTASVQWCCHRANSCLVRLFTSLLTANNGPFQEVCLCWAIKNRENPQTNERLTIYVVVFFLFNNAQNFIWRINCTLGASRTWQPAFWLTHKSLHLKTRLVFSCDPVSMVTLVCPPAAVWAFQPCST